MDFQFAISLLIKRYKLNLKKNISSNFLDKISINKLDGLLIACLITNLETDIEKDIINFFIDNKNEFVINNLNILGRGLSFIVSGKNPSKGFEFLRMTGLLEIYYGWLFKCYGVEQNEYHAHDVYYHLVYSCDAAVNEQPIRLSALFHDSGKVKAKRKINTGEDEKEVFYNHEIIGATITYKTLKTLGFDISICKQVSKLVRNHMFHYTDDWSDSAVRRFIKKAGNNMNNLFKLRDADRKGNGKRISTPAKIKEFKKRINKVIEYDKRLTVKDLDINGNHIMKKLDLEPGPVLGKILRYLLLLVEENPEYNNFDILLKEAVEYYDKQINK
mgnify:CR=1 FL=1